MSTIEDNECSFHIQTVQSGAFRILIEALKEILTDTNLIIDNTGIKLIATDNSKIVLIHMKLHSENFEHYYCKEKINFSEMWNLCLTQKKHQKFGIKL